VRDAVGSVVPFAAGVAVSPFPIVAVILVLFSRRARVNSPVFLVGWMIGLSIVVTATFLLVDRLDLDGAAGESVSWARVVLGGLLLIGAWRKWRADSDPTSGPERPRWMTGVERSSPRQVGTLALVLSANPKNLVLAVAAGAALGELTPTTSGAVGGLAAFVLIGSAPVILAVAYHALGGDRSTARLESARVWLMVHHEAMLATIYLIFGALLVSAGLGLR